MNGSYAIIVHFLGFGLVSALLTMSLLLERKFRSETDWDRKQYILGLMRPFKVLGPLAGIIMLLSGIGNIYNRFLDSPEPWYDEGWLVAKIVLFIIFAVTSSVGARLLMAKRMQLVASVIQQAHPADADQSLKRSNRAHTILYLAQLILLVAIVYLAVFGGSKHPGVF